jgi:uncharacterized membrane protein YqhA
MESAEFCTPKTDKTLAADPVCSTLYEIVFLIVSTRPRSYSRLLQRLESGFESAFWKLRLVAILPVLMTALSSVATFILGTKETLYALEYMLKSNNEDPEKVLAHILGGFVGGVDLYLIGLALLIFSYGTYELLISAIDPAREGDSGELVGKKSSSSFTGVLEVANLDDLKEKLVKVLVVALLVFAFKSMLSLPITDGQSLVYYCVALLLLSLSAYLVGRLKHSKS